MGEMIYSILVSTNARLKKERMHGKLGCYIIIMKWSIIMNVWDYKLLYMRKHVCIKNVKMDGWSI